MSTNTTMEFSQKQDAFIRMMCVLLQPHEVEDRHGAKVGLGVDMIGICLATWNNYINSFRDNLDIASGIIPRGPGESIFTGDGLSSRLTFECLGGI